jgi:hypothetical protein
LAGTDVGRTKHLGLWHVVGLVTVLVGNIVDGDNLTIGGGVRERSLDDQSFVFGAGVLQAGLFGTLVAVAGFESEGEREIRRNSLGNVV